MSAKTTDSDEYVFGVRHVTVVPTNFRKGTAAAARGEETASEDDAEDE